MDFDFCYWHAPDFMSQAVREEYPYGLVIYDPPATWPASPSYSILMVL